MTQRVAWALRLGLSCLAVLAWFGPSQGGSFVPPVAGPIKHAPCPVEDGAEFHEDDPETWYSTAWSGRYDLPPRCEGTGGHPGVDIRDRYGDLGVYAIADGVVIRKRRTGETGGWGNLIVIRHDGVVGYGTVYSVYAHLERFDEKVEEGQEGQIIVTRGEKIAIMGGTGGVPRHLHFQIDREWPTSKIKPFWPTYTDTDRTLKLYPARRGEICREPPQYDACLTDDQRKEAADAVSEHTVNPVVLVVFFD